MVKISILYPHRDGSRFDMNYYVKTHMPMAIEKLSVGKGYQGVSVERGVSGALPGSAPAFAAMCHFHFDSAEDFTAAFMPHAAVLMGDIPNYTDVEPVIQVNEIAIAK